MKVKISTQIFIVLVALAAIASNANGEQMNPEETGFDFTHVCISDDLPTINLNGALSVADYDNDGDLDATVGSLYNNLYLMKNNGTPYWQPILIGPLAYTSLDAAVLDINNDGWQDFVLAGYWYKNNQGTSFTRYAYDPRFQSGDHFHDIVAADLNNDGVKDIIGMGDDIGFFWYDWTVNPTGSWARIKIDPDYPDPSDHVHGGFSPGGVGDLDGDGDNDIFRANAWFENSNNGATWTKHDVYFPELFTGSLPYGKSTRSVIIDMDNDGDNDIVISECDDVDGKVGIIWNTSGDASTLELELLPQTAAGRRGSLHSLQVKDLNMDGMLDIVTIDQEDMIQAGMPSPRWYIFTKESGSWEEQVLLDTGLGGHALQAKDVDQDGDLDLISKNWYPWGGNATYGTSHADYLVNNAVEQVSTAVRLSTDVLSDWTQTGGLWEQKGDYIIGGKDPQNPDLGGLLMTKQKFGNFEVVFDVWPDYGIDSGIFLRTTSDGSRAFQITVDYQEDNPMGGVYLSGMSAAINWDFTIKDEDEINGDPIFFDANAWSYIWNVNDWNQFRVRIEGNPAKITTWINGWKVNEFEDSQIRLEDDGYIGLQVHTGDDWAEGKVVRYKNLKVYSLTPDAAKDFDQINRIGYYPSPVSDILNLTNLSGKSNISVFDVVGKKVIERDLNNQNSTIDMKKLTSGIYLVKIIDKSKLSVQSFKVIKN